jgi:hypothetical protein
MECESPLPNPPAAPPAHRLHSPASVTLATLLGTPVAGGIVLALNYWKWGRKGIAAAAVAAGLLITAVFAWLAWVAPAWVPAVVFIAPSVVGGYLVAKLLQGRRYDAHIADGGKRASNWIGAGIGVVITTPLAAAIVIGFVFSGYNPSVMVDAQYSVDMGQEQYVYYSRGATSDDALRFGEALKEYGYFDGTMPAHVLIAGRPGSREVSFPAGEGAWDDEFNVQSIRDLVTYIAPAIGGRPVTVRLLDEHWNEKKRLQIERGGWFRP